MSGGVGSALEPLQDAIVATLKDDFLLTSMVTGIFDAQGVPRGQAYPYIALGDTTETDDSTFDTIGYEATLTLHIWSMQPNAQEAQRILARMNRLLNGQPLTLADMSHVGTWYDGSQSLRDRDDTRLMHLAVRYRVGAGENEER